jgi:hypothetical protein
MALKRKISKAEYEKLSAELQTEYVADGDDFKLDLVGGDDSTALQNALARERQSRKDLEKELKEATDKLSNFDDKAKDIATLTAAHKEELAARDSKIAAYRNQSLTAKLNDEALKLATKLNSTNPKLVLPHIKERLAAKFAADDSDDVLLEIFDANGKPSKLTADDLFKEFVDSKEFAPIITGSKAQGSASAGGQQKGSAFNQTPATNTEKLLHQLSPTEMAAHIAAKKEAAQ